MKHFTYFRDITHSLDIVLHGHLHLIFNTISVLLFFLMSLKNIPRCYNFLCRLVIYYLF